MKKIKRDRKSAGRRVVTGIVLVCVLAVAAGCWCALRGELEALRDGRFAMLQELGAMQNSRELKVSDDGKWFLIPEVRIRWPFFAQWKPLSEEFQLDAPRYNRFIWVDEGVAVAIGGETHGSNWAGAQHPYGCGDPFIILIGGAKQMDVDFVNNAKYETFSEIRLADGRDVKLQVRTAGSSDCMRSIEGTWGEKMKEALSKIQSY